MSRTGLERARALLGPNATLERRRCAEREYPRGWHPPMAPPGCSGAMYGAGQGHGRYCPGGQPFVVIGVARGVGGIGFNVIKGAGRTVDDAIADVEKNEAADRLRYAPLGVCTAPRGKCGHGARSARQPAAVDRDGTLRCACGAPMRRAKRRAA